MSTSPYECVKVLVDAYSDDAQLGSVLFPAVGRGETAILNLLVGRGADINQRRQEDSLTPLMVAAAVGSPEVVSWLLEHGANSGVTDSNGKNAHNYALEHQNQAAADILAKSKQ